MQKYKVQATHLERVLYGEEGPRRGENTCDIRLIGLLPSRHRLGDSSVWSGSPASGITSSSSTLSRMFDCLQIRYQRRRSALTSFQRLETWVGREIMCVCVTTPINVFKITQLVLKNDSNYFIYIEYYGHVARGSCQVVSIHIQTSFIHRKLN